MEQKTISISPNLFQMGKSNSSPKTKKSMSLKIQKPTNIKRDLIKKIRNYQNKTKKRKNYPMDEEFNSEFKDSIEYLRNVMSEKKISESDHNTNINQNVEKNISSHDQQHRSNMTTTTIPKSDTPWGNMKNGNKPTYRTWIKHNQTQKIPKEVNQQRINSYIEKERLPEAQFHIPNKDETEVIAFHKSHEMTPMEKPQKKKIKKRTIKKKYTCGKSKTKKQIAIIIKGIETKNKVLKEQRELRQASIQTIRNYLYKKSFIKVGSTAPDKVLRDMYESIILTGDVNNKNSHILIHNYMNENI
jgi:hypothetical protein